MPALMTPPSSSAPEHQIGTFGHGRSPTRCRRRFATVVSLRRLHGPFGGPSCDGDDHHLPAVELERAPATAAEAHVPKAGCLEPRDPLRRGGQANEVRHVTHGAVTMHGALD